MAAVRGCETKTSTPVEPSSEAARRRRMEIHRFRFLASDAAVAPPPLDGGLKRQRAPSPPEPETAVETVTEETSSVKRRKAYDEKVERSKEIEQNLIERTEPEEIKVSDRPESSSSSEAEQDFGSDCPKFGMTSVCGRRRDMEDAVAAHPCFSRKSLENSRNMHFFGVYDGHGCSHVAMRCRDRMHEIVRDAMEKGESTWPEIMSRSFSKMDQEITDLSNGAVAGAVPRSVCRCEFQTPQCDAVGSTAVVAVVTPDHIIVSNCGDSRAVLCRNGVAIPLSVDHKPDRPDELNRIEEAGGRVIYWDGPRVLGVLAMSRAIGDNYLKPYVISEPEITITKRTAEDECLILASDGLWDVVSNETACGVARMCLQQRGKPPSPLPSPGNDVTVTPSSDKACSDASILLTKLALARHTADNVSVVVVDLRNDL
ncbi:protein phosphatase 2C 37-like [Ipomoea triloba]|uniref:protein phosphatase 2C 37-like n=1 Tax=Ipomoea triloba TaxID=35885 RepID=UPI00125E93F6|nr:protein phosphatase 2C 37-like [Ipomoea triloba]